jgi:galactokinase
MKSGDVKKLGELFNQSHNSLRDDYEVTNDALNFIVDSAREAPGCYGARMTGAGFGGCAVALIEADKAQEFENAVKAKYAQKSGKDAAIFICKASAGAELVS